MNLKLLFSLFSRYVHRISVLVLRTWWRIVEMKNTDSTPKSQMNNLNGEENEMRITENKMLIGRCCILWICFRLRFFFFSFFFFLQWCEERQHNSFALFYTPTITTTTTSIQRTQLFWMQWKFKQIPNKNNSILAQFKTSTLNQ